MPRTTTHVLGLDPGLNTTGYGVVAVSKEGFRVAEAGVLTSKASLDLAERVKQLHDGLIEILDQWKPSAIALEQLYAHYDHPRTAVLMAHARGGFLLAGASRGIPVFDYAATQVKKMITGHGRASKEQMQHAIQRELGLDKLPEPHDVSDALGLALCHAYASGNIVHGANSATFTE